ncbi:MAG: hypothetical protein IPK59_02935 [Rhodospirillaceae bacterium]|nr:hypothetical protein [Rhodospirillaceae bacterium]
MADDDQSRILARMREARSKARGYADFFQWPNRDIEELGVLQELAKTLESVGSNFLSGLRSRGRGFDPPDCEATDTSGRRVAVELTELVDQAALEATVANRRNDREGQLDAPYFWAEWDIGKFEREVGKRLIGKHNRFDQLQDGPYPGGYVVVLYTDEPALSRILVKGYAAQVNFAGVSSISRAFIVLSYDSDIEMYPAIELAIVR